eukprot:GHVR01162050.1.p1 GENE.GHVR01162050.1~~GHVR01162050.1.p1  ORF type:complete len:203 (+),score=26.02 GHVR01162050.1:2436-3044(+)
MNTHNVYFIPEQMLLSQLYIPIDTVKQIVHSLGNAKTVEFCDLLTTTNTTNRRHTTDIKHIDDIHKKLTWLITETKQHLPIFDRSQKQINEILSHLHTTTELKHIENEITSLYTRIQDINNTINTLSISLISLHEEYTTYKHINTLLHSSTIQSSMNEYNEHTSLLEINKQNRLNYITGIIDTNRVIEIETILWKTLILRCI